MSTAFLALWNDYPASMTQEYEAWHTFEHVPERLTAQGMRAARRYGSRDGGETYFTLYELQDLTTIEHPSYLDLVRNPTAWSLKMREHFSNVLRIPGEIFSVAGHGIGGCAIVQAYSIERTRAQLASPDLDRGLLEILANGRILGFRIGFAEPNQMYEVFAQNDTTDPDTVNLVLFVEGSNIEALSETQAAICDLVTSLVEPRKTLRNNIFNLLVTYSGDEFLGDRSEITVSIPLRLRFG